MSSSDGSTVAFRRTPATIRIETLQRFVRRLEREVSKGRPFDCLITGDAELRRLNLAFRGKDQATDVLSFPSAPEAGSKRQPRLGDIAISLARARAQARQFGHSTEREIEILMLHGLLHLMGMDHETDGGRMARVEKTWRVRLGMPASLTERVSA